MSGEVSAGSIWLRPERAAAGRPAQHTRAEITAAALRIADADGLEAVSMRRVGAGLGTGAASLYRYVETRDELLDLMTDATAAEYRLRPPPGPAGQPAAGRWLTELVDLGEQARAIMRRHRWLAGLSLTRPVIGPNAVAVIERFLDILAGHPASLDAKFEAFAMLNGLTAASVLHEQAGGPALQERNVGYLTHAIAAGGHPRLTELVTVQPQPQADADPASRYPDLLARVLVGLLGDRGETRIRSDYPV